MKCDKCEKVVSWTYLELRSIVIAPQIIPWQVVRNTKGSTEAERAASGETGKPKEVDAGGRWNGSLLKGLQGTGETLVRFLTKPVWAESISQNVSVCPSSLQPSHRRVF